MDNQKKNQTWKIKYINTKKSIQNSNSVNYGILLKNSFKLILKRELEFKFLKCRGKVL